MPGILRGRSPTGEFQEVAVDEQGNLIAPLALRFEDYGGGILYVGEAPVGTLDDQPYWRIMKINTNSPLSITWADGNTKYDNRWDQRGTLSYS